jgi:hypothetical protein
LSYEDGVQGEIDLAHLAGKGVFRAWEKPGAFDRVHLAPYGAIAWSDDLDLCPDSLYLELTGKQPEEVFPALRSAPDA